VLFLDKTEVTPLPAKETINWLIGTACKTVAFPQSHIIFRQGDSADTVFYIEEGKVTLTVVSETGKEAIVSILGGGDFLGEAVLARQPVRMETARALTYCKVLRIEKDAIMLAFQREPRFNDLFLAGVLARTVRYEQDLIDQLLNFSEKRLARILLLLARSDNGKASGLVSPNLSQGTLAEMVGTTRSRINVFMNKFRTSGFINYGRDGIQVHSSLLSMVLKD
jgi:CRP/FNR family transcriptional regulator, cyclic AMP receptor protein